MAQFYGRVHGNRGEATRMGSKASGIRATAETWRSVLVVAFRHLDGSDTDRGSFAIQGKHGSTIFQTSVNFDDVVRAHAADDEGVRDALRKLGDAFSELDVAGRAYRTATDKAAA